MTPFPKKFSISFEPYKEQKKIITRLTYFCAENLDDDYAAHKRIHLRCHITFTVFFPLYNFFVVVEMLFVAAGEIDTIDGFFVGRPCSDGK